MSRYLLHWVIPCGHTHLCCKKDSLWRWHKWNEGASCCIRPGKWASNASPFCTTLLFFTLSPVHVINNSFSFLFLVFEWYYYIRVKYILNTLCAAWGWNMCLFPAILELECCVRSALSPATLTTSWENGLHQSAATKDFWIPTGHMESTVSK